MQLYLLLSNGFNKKNISVLHDRRTLTKVQEKTGIQFYQTLVIQSGLPYAQMWGFPGRPTMLVSSMLLTEFNAEEREYVYLHEIGHYHYQHSIKEAVVFVLMYILGAIILLFLSSTLVVSLLAVLIGAITGIWNIQIARLFEYQADQFALSHLENPHAMKSATEKFKKAYPGVPEHSLKRMLFYRGVPYSERIKMAEEKIKGR